jgi:hypothetical protein
MKGWRLLQVKQDYIQDICMIFEDIDIRVTHRPDDGGSKDL